MRIAITTRTSTDRYGERFDSLAQQWSVEIERLGAIPIPVPQGIDSPVSWLKDLKPDRIVFSGGNSLCDRTPPPEGADAQRDRNESAILDLAFSERIPVLGVCRGLQLFNWHTSQKPLTRISGHAGTEHLLRPTPAAVRILPNTGPVNSFHDYAYMESDISAEWNILALAEDGVVEAIMHKHRPALGIQWHPERPAPCADFIRPVWNWLIDPS